MLTPRPYLSYTQIATYERSSDEYARKYLFGEKTPVTRNMRYGSQLADGLEHDESTGDLLLDLVMEKLPKFELMDVAFEVPLKNGKENIILLAKPDTYKKDFSAFKEYKTSIKKWTQKTADESDQITFYATAMWLKTGKIPQDIELVNAQTKYDENGDVTVTGDIFTFKTQRKMSHIINMTSRVRKCWKGIQELCERELL